MAEPGPFGWISSLMRWSNADASQQGAHGPMPPPRANFADPTDMQGRDPYQGWLDQWMHSTSGASLTSFFSEPRTRKELYMLYEKMDMTDIAGAFLDTISEDATEFDHRINRRIWVTGPEAIVNVTDNMLQRLKADEDAPAQSRDLAKFGDILDRLVYRSGIDGGVMRMVPIMPLAVTRSEDKDGKLVGYTQVGRKFKNGNDQTSYPWDFAHFRIRGRDRRYPYGTSLLYNGIRPWRSFILLDDWVTSTTLSRGVDRNMLLLDIGTGSDGEAIPLARKIQTKLRKYVMIDPTGASGANMAQRPNPASPTEDIILPIRPGSETRIERLYGSHATTDMLPLNSNINRFFAAIRAPQAFFGFATDPMQLQQINPKATLCDQDIRYMRQARRLQNAMKAGYRFMAELNLRLCMAPGEGSQQYSADELAILDYSIPGNDFEIHMAQISFLDELRALEVETTRQQVALGMMEMGLNNPAVDIFRWTNYVFREIVKVPDDELSEIIRTDLEPEHLDNMAMGLTPEGQPIPTGNSKTESAIRRRTTLAMQIAERVKADRGAGSSARDADLSNGEKRVLSEMIRKNANLRDLINKGRAIFHPDAPVPHGGVLPNNELIAKGFLQDNIVESEINQMIEESRKECGLPPRDDADDT